MVDQIVLKPIGHVRCGREEPIDDKWDAVPAMIELDKTTFDAESLQGLAEFSHVEILFVFDRVEDFEVISNARHPRDRLDWPRVGIFAQRGKNRPNKIGATICKIVEVAGTQLQVIGLDAIDGTPVLDIKPVMSGFLPRGLFREPDWSKEIMESYW